MRKEITTYSLTGIISILLHISIFGGLHSFSQVESPTKATVLEFAVIPPPPPPPPPKKDIEPVKKPPPPKKMKARKIKVRKKETKKKPPPPNRQAVKEPAKEAIPTFGLTLESTVGPSKGADFSVRVGNTIMKDPEKKFTSPDKVKAYQPVPIHQTDTQPKVLQSFQAPYPTEAKANQVEGQILLEVEVLEDGKVGKVTIIKGLGYGLDQASINALKKFVFSPATKGAVPVPVIIQYSYRWVLQY